ncbi:RdgB/HAM1 family non-canonical purine NTP pyrophosphatase [Kosmotoga pacifica]|uniref:dITP/XTP pyrophosphatase n=1 Tax=Kosmotoga pacifica TaxID=1330330 RepID=A0A0G2Z8A9_9BACT|nr:RdgB/HAM1 family non-canonical purine NTP pyrophosphatase [Kosmotoga pacifica]AKI97850.1 xanthosine triphosphate pyrophosphatase [Kosmotoga pacifica]
MNLKIHLVTGNNHKVEEIRSLADNELTVVPISDLVGEIEVDEKGDTFLQNALIKVETFRHLGIPLVADDSGLEIDALNGFPGVQSSRFMEGRPYSEKMAEILQRLDGEKNRKARFKCAAVFYHPSGVVLAVEGTVEGSIAYEIRGEQGFGYDPIFVPDGYDRTFGELGQEVKSIISHRARAFKKLFSLLRLFFSNIDTEKHHKSSE